MSTFVSIFVVVLQLIVGQLAGFVTAMALGIGNGAELFVIPLGNSFGVWFVGIIAATLRGTYDSKQYMFRLVGTLLGSVLGVGLILLTPAIGGIQIIFPLLGALLGYYVMPLVVGLFTK